MPVAELALIAGVTERDIYALVRRLNCRPRRPQVRFPGRSLGPRREFKPRRPLNEVQAAQALASFRDLVRALRQHGDARRAAELQRGIDRAQRRASHVASGIALMRARELRAAVAELEHQTAVEARVARALWQARRMARFPDMRRRARLPEPRVNKREELPARQRRLAEQCQWDMDRAHERAAAERAAAAARREELAPVIDEATAKRINEIAAEYDRRAQGRGPRIRSWD